jgi:hypothetical protein
VVIASVITVVIGFAKYQPLGVLFALVEAATRTNSKGWPDIMIGLPLPARHQVAAVDDQFSTHSRRAAKQQQQVHKLERSKGDATTQLTVMPRQPSTPITQVKG